MQVKAVLCTAEGTEYAPDAMTNMEIDRLLEDDREAVAMLVAVLSAQKKASKRNVDEAMTKKKGSAELTHTAMPA